MCGAKANVRFVPIADIVLLLDHLVRAPNYCVGDVEAKRLCSFEIDNQFDLSGPVELEDWPASPPLEYGRRILQAHGKAP
jgi:hypothetical protein